MRSRTTDGHCPFQLSPPDSALALYISSPERCRFTQTIRVNHFRFNNKHQIVVATQIRLKIQDIKTEVDEQREVQYSKGKEQNNIV